MMLSSCHDYSLNNNCHCCCHCHSHYMQRICVYFILSCLDFPFCEWISITIVIIGLTLYELVLHYITISYLMFFNFFFSADLISILFYSILFYIISNRFDLVLFYSLLLNSIYYIVQYCISYQ